MAELRTSQALRQQLHTSLDAAVDQLQRLYAGMQAETGFLLECAGQDEEERGQQQVHLDNESSYDVADAQRRASVVIHMLELVHDRCAATV